MVGHLPHIGHAQQLSHVGAGGARRQSLAGHMSQQVDSMIAAGGSASMFSTRNDAGPSYVWRVGRAFKPIDLTGVTVWNNDGTADKTGGYLISPRHVRFPWHYEVTAVRFVKLDGTVVSRNVTQRYHVTGADTVNTPPGDSDHSIGLLDSDVPAGIKIYKCLPANWASYLPPGDDRIPLLSPMNTKAAGDPTNDRVAVVWDSDHTSLTQNSIVGYTSGARVPTDAARLAYSVVLTSGCSGFPVGPVINGEFVPLTGWSVNYGPAVHAYIDRINAAMTAVDAANGVSSGYQLTPIDLSGFRRIS